MNSTPRSAAQGLGRFVSVAMIGDAHSRRMALGSALALSVYIASAALASISQFLLARVIGAEGYGNYSYVLAYATILASFATLGFDVALIRFVSAYQALSAWGLLKGVVRYAHRCALATAGAITVLGLVVVYARADSLPPGLRVVFAIGLLLVPILSLTWIRCSMARASGNVLLALVPDRIMRDGMLVAVVLVASWMGLSIGAVGAMGATVAGALAGLAVLVVGVRLMRAPGIAAAAPERNLAAWRGAIIPLVLIGAGELVINRTGVICLGLAHNYTDAGVFGLVFNIAFVVTLPKTAVNTLFSPRISALFASGKHAELKALIGRTTRWTLSVSGLMVVGILLLADPALAWFGEAYRNGATALKVMAVAQLIVVAMGSQVNILTMTGNEKSGAALIAAFAAGNFVLSYVLVQFFGLIGAAFATSFMIIGWNMAMASAIWRRLKLRPGFMEMI